MPVVERRDGIRRGGEQGSTSGMHSQLARREMMLRLGCVCHPHGSYRTAGYVTRTSGRLGIMLAMEGDYPENGRGLAMNGAEAVYRASLPGPFTQNDIFEISNRARALENNMYILAPNISFHGV